MGEPISGGGIPGWQATATWGDLARFLECFRTVYEHGDARKTPEGLLDILIQAVGK